MALKKGSYFTCNVCKEEFWRKPSAIQKGQNKFCSRNCFFVGQKGSKKQFGYRPHVVGKNNPNWRGGVTPTIQKIRNSKEMKEWRLHIFRRDNWTCQKCGVRSSKNKYVYIEAHHIKPFATFPELRFEITNGITLCKACHYKEPKGKEIWKIK